MKSSKETSIKVSVYDKPKVSSPLCGKNNREMIEKGKSKRGFPLFYCATSGLKIEKGVSRVKVLFEEKGYGFINLPKGADDLFFLFSKVSEHSGSIKQGDKVEFTVGINPKKNLLQALDVRKVDYRNNVRER